MPTKAFLRLTANGTEINGSATAFTGGDVERWINILAVDHEVTVPREAGTGMATGKREHGPLVLTKELDCSSPLLAKALCMNETITAELRIYDDWAARGTFVHRYTIRLENGFVAALKTELLNTAYTDTAALKMRQKLSLVYQTITWTWEEGGIEHTDRLSDSA